MSSSSSSWNSSALSVTVSRPKLVLGVSARPELYYFLCLQTTLALLLMSNKDAMLPSTYQLCFRCYTSGTNPLENAWFFLLGFQVSEGTIMAPEEFFIQLQMSKKVSTACKRKSEGVHSGKRSERFLIQKTADTIKSEFVQDMLSYVQHLTSEVLRQTELSSKFIKGLAAFDLHIMFKRPLEVALRHFDVLFSTFQCRSWISASNDSSYRHQYVELLDHLRAKYSTIPEVTDAAEDLIDFLMKLDILKAREHLLYLFKLRCLCVISASPTYPDVKVGSIDTSGLWDRFIHIVLPIQSYLSGVPGSVARLWMMPVSPVSLFSLPLLGKCVLC